MDIHFLDEDFKCQDVSKGSKEESIPETLDTQIEIPDRQTSGQEEIVPDVSHYQTPEAAGHRNQTYSNSQIHVPWLYPCPTQQENLLGPIIDL